MSIRKIDTTLSTIRSVYDEKGNYLPSGNYYFTVNDYDNGIFKGEMKMRGDFGEFSFSPRKLIKMMAVGQSRLEGAFSSDGSGFMPSSSTSIGFGSSSSTRQPTTTLIPRKKLKKRPATTSTNDVSVDYKSMYENCNNKLNNLKTQLMLCREKSRELGVKLLKKETEYEELLKQLKGGRKRRKTRRKKKKRKKRSKKRR